MSRQDWTSGSRDRGICPVCGRDFEITRKGVLRQHAGAVGTGSPGWTRAYRCAGAGKPPAADTPGRQGDAS